MRKGKGIKRYSKSFLCNNEWMMVLFPDMGKVGAGIRIVDSQI